MTDEEKRADLAARQIGFQKALEAAQIEFGCVLVARIVSEVFNEGAMVQDRATLTLLLNNEPKAGEG